MPSCLLMDHPFSLGQFQYTPICIEYKYKFCKNFLRGGPLTLRRAQGRRPRSKRPHLPPPNPTTMDTESAKIISMSYLGEMPDRAEGVHPSSFIISTSLNASLPTSSFPSPHTPTTWAVLHPS